MRTLEVLESLSYFHQIEAIQSPQFWYMTTSSWIILVHDNKGDSYSRLGICFCTPSMENILLPYILKRAFAMSWTWSRTIQIGNKLRTHRSLLGMGARGHWTHSGKMGCVLYVYVYHSLYADMGCICTTIAKPTPLKYKPEYSTDMRIRYHKNILHPVYYIPPLRASLCVVTRASRCTVAPTLAFLLLEDKTEVFEIVRSHEIPIQSKLNGLVSLCSCSPDSEEQTASCLCCLP